MPHARRVVALVTALGFDVAPELLEALQDMHEVLREAMSTGGWVPTPVQDSFRDAWFSMTAAMTKATGGEA